MATWSWVIEATSAVWNMTLKDVSNMNINSVMSIDFSKYIDLIVSGIISYFPKIIWAIIIVWVWFKLVDIIQSWIEKLMSKQRIDPMLKWFLSSLLNWILKILVIVSAAWVLWIQTSSFVAMIAAAGLAIWLSLKWTLQNFAGGVIILLFKPFKIWNWVEIASYSGEVKDIHIFNTRLLTGDKKRIIIPNSDIISSPMINYSSEPKRRVDLIVWISYDDDIDKAKKVLDNIAKSDERIIYDEWITLWVWELWADSVNIDFRFIVKSGDYWSVYRDTLEAVKKAFDKEWLHIPYPQRDIHIYNHNLKSK